MEEVTATPEMTDLANALSDAMAAAMRGGLEPDRAIGIAAAVVADYGRGYFGDGYLVIIAQIVLKRAGFEMPDKKEVH